MNETELTIKYACELSYKLWYWLFKNLGKRKCDSPYWDEIKNYRNLCPLCEVFAINGRCGKCIGNTPGCFGRAYDKWLLNRYDKKNSAHIAYTIRKFMIKEGWYDKKIR